MQICDKKISAVEFTAKASKVLQAADPRMMHTPALKFCAGTKKDVSSAVCFRGHVLVACIVQEIRAISAERTPNWSILSKNHFIVFLSRCVSQNIGEGPMNCTVQWSFGCEDVNMIRSGMKVLVMQPQAAALRRLNDLLQAHDIKGVNLFLDEADTLWSNRAGVDIANPSFNERERSLYKLMGPIASRGSHQVPLLQSRIRTIVAVAFFPLLDQALGCCSTLLIF